MTLRLAAPAIALALASCASPPAPAAEPTPSPARAPASPAAPVGAAPTASGALAPPSGSAPAQGHDGAHHGAHAPHDPIGHRFTEADRWAKRFDDPGRASWQRPAEVVRLLAIRPGMTVADIGAGTGYFLPHLATAVTARGKVLGIDIEPDMVRYMQERADREGLDHVEARLATTSDPGLEPGSVDRILIVNTWHHIPERAAYAARLRRALAPSGLVAIVDYTLDAERGPPKLHRLPPAQVITELQAGGFDAAVVDESLPDQYVVIGRDTPAD